MPVEIRHTTCVMDCPDACALEVEVRDGRVARIRGGRDHPNTAGFICDKVARFDRRLEHAERVLQPMRRVGAKGEGRFERIPWDAAIAEVAGRLAEVRERWGGEAILPYHYGGSNGLLTDDLTDDLFFARLAASRLAKTICAAPTTAVATAMYGKMPGVAFEDYPRARAIVIWGANPKASNIHLVPYLREAKRRGAFLAVVDPRRNFSDAEADLHLPVLPGTDLAVALAMVRLWDGNGRLDRAFLERHATGWEAILAAAREWPLERAASAAGVEAAAIRRLAGAYAEGEPAVIRCGWGLERNRNGGRAVAAVLALPALLGKFGVRAGGYTLSNSGAYRLDRRALLGDLAWNTRVLDMTRLGRLLEGELSPPPVKALFVYNANPAATVPDQGRVLRGLAREDLFTVVSEQVMTDTARYADVLLPAVTFLEGWDLRGGYGSFVFGGAPPVVAARGEARSNHAVFSALARAMGFADEPFAWSDERLATAVAAAVTLGGGRRPDFARLAAGGNEPIGFDGGPAVQFGSILPRTSDGKVHLAPPLLGPEPFRFEKSANTYPLALISPATSKLISSTLGEVGLTELSVAVHPRDAEARAIRDGDRVRVHNELGEVVCRARVSDRVRPGVVSMPKGAWRRASGNGSTATALCPDHLSEVGPGACFNDARVEIAPLVP